MHEMQISGHYHGERAGALCSLTGMTSDALPSVPSHGISDEMNAPASHWMRPRINRQTPCTCNHDTIRYDTIRDAILTCTRKPTRVSLIYRTKPTTKKCKTEKLKSKTGMLKSNSKQSGESVESVLKKKRKATVRRICRKARF